MSGAALLFVSFFILLLLNVPIAFCLGISSIVTMQFLDVSLTTLPMNIYAGIGKFTLLAIPFFVLAGCIMEKAGISAKLINLADKMVGHKKEDWQLSVLSRLVFSQQYQVRDPQQWRHWERLLFRQ